MPRDKSQRSVSTPTWVPVISRELSAAVRLESLTYRRLPLPRLAVGVCAILLTWTSAASAALIQLKDSVEVSGSVVRLVDLADIRDADEKLVEKLSAVTLFPAPAAGRSKAVDFETIRSRLISQGFNLSQLEFSGSSVVTVTGARQTDGAGGTNPAVADLAQRRAEELVGNAIKQYVREKAPSLGNVEVELELTPKQVALLSAALSAKVDIYGGSEPWVGRLPLRAGFYDRQGRRQEFLVGCRVKPLPQVLVPTANLPKGHVVRADDVTWKQQPPTAKATYVDEPELVVGQETKRALRAGEPIASVDIRSVPLVRRGDIVTVVARNRGIVVRTDARALDDGGLGQLIKLVSLDGRRELSARVSGFHEASVPPPDANEPLVTERGTGLRLVMGEPQPRAPGSAARKGTGAARAGDPDASPGAGPVIHAGARGSGARPADVNRAARMVNTQMAMQTPGGASR